MCMYISAMRDCHSGQLERVTGNGAVLFVCVLSSCLCWSAWPAACIHVHGLYTCLHMCPPGPHTLPCDQWDWWAWSCSASLLPGYWIHPLPHPRWSLGSLPITVLVTGAVLPRPSQASSSQPATLLRRFCLTHTITYQHAGAKQHEGCLGQKQTTVPFILILCLLGCFWAEKPLAGRSLCPIGRA